MTTFNWFGGYGHFAAARFWDPRGVPGAGDTAAVGAGASVIEGGAVVVNAPLAGQGTILMVNGLGSHEGYGHAGSLELGGPVGAGETIGINVGNVVIDRPTEFAGILDFQPDVGDFRSHDTATQGVLLKGLAASSYGFDDAAHRLTLWGGDTVLDTIQFSQGTTSGSFHMGQYASIDVLQTDGGVYLRGSYNLTQGAEIPLHAAPAAA